MKFNLVVALLLIIPSIALSDDVYKWVDKSGNVHFSSKPPTSDAKPAQLPKIMRSEVKLTNSTLLSCESHGGVNCEAGADADRSVICYDGFKDATARFAFNCTGAKLEVADISPLNKDGSFQVTVRNRKQAVAQDVSISIKNSAGKKLILSGPTTIGKLASEEYSYVPTAPSDPSQGNIGFVDAPNAGEIDMTCRNCP